MTKRRKILKLVVLLLDEVYDQMNYNFNTFKTILKVPLMDASFSCCVSNNTSTQPSLADQASLRSH
jgi:aspartate/methionine/tyrosine aminotransferase